MAWATGVLVLTTSFVLWESVHAYVCATDVHLGEPASPSKKGLVLDDTTFHACPQRIPWPWPNTRTGVGSLRLFKAWDSQWASSGRELAWRSLVDFITLNDVHVLLGTQVTCESAKDDQDWAWTKALLQMLPPSQIMGVAIGNELDILWDKAKDGVYSSITEACVRNLWSGEFWVTFQQRVADLDALGYSSVRVTSVFTGVAFGGYPFLDGDGARVNTFLLAASTKYGERFVFTFNFYPYFDPNYVLDAGSKDQCSQVIGSATCFVGGEGGACTIPKMTAVARGNIQRLTGTAKHLFWVGETGWSSPRAQSLHTNMEWCSEWSTMHVFRQYYEGFLSWNLDAGGQAAPDHVFYFDVRDSFQFGVAEGFGLIDNCGAAECKIRTANLTAPDEFKVSDLRLGSWYFYAWWGLGALFLSILVSTYIVVKINDKMQARRARLEACRRQAAASSSAA